MSVNLTFQNLTIDQLGTIWKDKTVLPINECISWCKDQHIARIYHNEWLVVIAIMFLACYYIIQFAERTSLFTIPENYKEVLMRLKSGSLMAASFVLLAYGYLLSVSLQ